MRSRDLIDGFDYNEHMQRQMFCFGSSDDSGDSDSSYSGGLDFDEEFSGDYGPSTSPSVGGGGGGGSDGGSSYSDLGMSPGQSQAQFGTPEFGGEYTSLVPMLPTGEGTATPHLTWNSEPFKVGEPTILELAGCRNRYHCPMSRTVHLGPPPARMAAVADVAVEAINITIDMMNN